ncbi:MAG: hypothetical protein AABY68_05145 [Pseudomonadota bacterium]
MATKRICLVTPGHLSTNPRLVKEADALSAAGFEVTVVASRFIAWADAADREFEIRPWRVVKTVFGPLAGRPKHIGQALRQKCFAFWFRLTGYGAELAYHPVIPALTRKACAVPADLYIAHNLAALPAAYRAARRHNAKLAFDAEDFHRGVMHEDGQNALLKQHISLLESRYIHQCHYLTAASPGIARAYMEALHIPKPEVILNVFPLADAPLMPSRVEIPPSLYWFSQTLGADRGLESALKAIAVSLTRPRLVLRGQVTEAYRNTLLKLAADLGVAHLLSFQPPAAPSEMMRLAAEHSAGLASEQSDTFNHDICLSNKIFTYLLAGLPVLATRTSAQVELAADCTGAIHLYEQDDIEQLAAHIDHLIGNPQRLAEAREVAWRLGRECYNWEQEQQKLLTLVQSALVTSL